MEYYHERQNTKQIHPDICNSSTSNKRILRKRTNTKMTLKLFFNTHNLRENNW